jgi:polyhydroxyalkanoate synthesis regulator phasin
LIEQTAFTSIGLALKSKAEVREFAKDFVRKVDLSEREGKKFIEGLLKRSDKAREKLEEKVEKIVRDIVSRSGLTTKDELEEIKAEIKKLKKLAATQ